MKTIMAWLCLFFLFLACYFRVNANMRHQAYPITQSRIDAETDPEKKSALRDIKQMRDRDVLEYQEKYNRYALWFLILSTGCGVLYFWLRRLESAGRSQ